MGLFFYLDHVSFSHVVCPLHRTEISAARHGGGCEDTEGGEAGGEGEGEGVEGGGGWQCEQDTEADCQKCPGHVGLIHGLSL